MCRAIVRGCSLVRIAPAMIDYFALALGHGLLAIALLRMVFSDDLDVDPAITANHDAETQARADALATRKQAARDQAHGEADTEARNAAGLES